MFRYPFSRKGEAFHYAWVVLFCAMILGAFASASRNSFGVLINPLTETYGWSRGDISMAYSVTFGSAVLISLLFSKFIELLGARVIILIGIIGIVPGLVLTGTTTTLWELYVFYGLLSGGMGFLLNIVIPVTITRWFEKGVGLATGLMWASLGVGGMLGPVLFRWSIYSIGWRTTFYGAGLILGSAMLPALFFFRNRPQDIGEYPYGEKTTTLAEPTKKIAGSLGSSHQMTFNLIWKNPAFWNLINIHFLGCVGHSILLAHIVSIAISKGVSGLSAAAILSTTAAMSSISRFVTSIVTERFGGRKTLAIAFFMQAAPIPLFLFSTEKWHFFILAILFGLGYGAEMPSFPIINKQYWGGEAPLGRIYSFQLSGALAGMALGGWVGGKLFDLTGFYDWSIIVAFLSTVLALIPIWFLPKSRSKLLQLKS